MAMKLKACKVCKTKFEPTKPLQIVCSPLCAVKYTQAQKLKAWNKEKVQKKKELMTLSDHLKITQAVVNQYIRLRDEGERCISCGRTIKGVRHASHYLSAGGHSNVRFHEDNIWVSCYKCNVMLSGNQIKYRKRLIKKIGIERVEWLEENGSKVKQWTRDELKELVSHYKEKIKKMKKNIENAC